MIVDAVDKDLALFLRQYAIIDANVKVRYDIVNMNEDTVSMFSNTEQLHNRSIVQMASGRELRWSCIVVSSIKLLQNKRGKIMGNRWSCPLLLEVCSTHAI